jgi:hypothetical protein
MAGNLRLLGWLGLPRLGGGVRVVPLSLRRLAPVPSAGRGARVPARGRA